jgi:hypothetical protein
MKIRKVIMVAAVAIVIAEYVNQSYAQTSKRRRKLFFE